VIAAGQIITEHFPDCTNQGACRAFLRNFELLVFNTYRPVVILDMSRAPQMNAAGIDLLLSCITEVAKRDGALKLAAPSAQTELILELTQLTGMVESFGTVEQALASSELHAWTAARQAGPRDAA
jgi:anti-anti-sigma regulatory factor